MSYFAAGTGNGARETSMRIRLLAAAGGGRGRHGRCGVLKLVVQHKRGERHAVQRLSFGVGRGGIRRRAEDRDDRRRERGHQGPGFTLYSFAPDTATASKCKGSCAQIWPPATGPAAAGQDITGTLGMITRADGSTQATYDGHPLYTYTADTAPGQAKGNGLNVKAACGTRSPRPADGSSPARLAGRSGVTSASRDSGPFGAVQAKTTGALSGARHTTILQ
jgi:predicted lipoprotein with Yx(FWY)xxD motif